MRARLLKPGFFTNEDLTELPFEARLLFAGLWTLADREGRLEDRPKRIKGELFPHDDISIDGLLNELGRLGFIERYEAEGARYIQVLAFGRHQSPHVREPASTIPAPGQHQAGPAEAVAVPRSGSGFLDPETVAVAVAVAVAVPGPDDVDDEGAAAADPDAVTRLIRVWERETGATVTPAFAERCDDELRAGTSEEWIADAFRETGGAGVRKPAYAWAVLERWKREGREREPTRIDDSFEDRKARFMPPGGLAERYAAAKAREEVAS